MQRSKLVRLFASNQGIPISEREQWCANLEKELEAAGIGKEISTTDISQFQKALAAMKKKD